MREGWTRECCNTLSSTDGERERGRASKEVKGERNRDWLTGCQFMSCCKQVFMPVRGGTHYFSLSLSLFVFLSPSLAYQTSTRTITSTIAEQRWASKGRMTHSEMRHQGLTQPLETSSLRHPLPLSHPLTVFFSLLLANTNLSLEISNVSVCAFVCVHAHCALVNFVGVFEDSDRLYARRPSATGVLALCLTLHTCCCLWCFQPPAEREEAVSSNANTRQEEEDR